VHDRPVEKIGERRKADMRVGPHVQRLIQGKHRRSHLVEEDERPTIRRPALGKADIETIAQIAQGARSAFRRGWLRDKSSWGLSFWAVSGGFDQNDFGIVQGGDAQGSSSAMAMPSRGCAAMPFTSIRPLAETR
jgi:hypothetical protein